MRIVGPGEYQAEHEHDLAIAENLHREAVAAQNRAEQRLLTAQMFFRDPSRAKELIVVNAHEAAQVLDRLMAGAGEIMETLTHDAYIAMLEEERWETSLKAGVVRRSRSWRSTVEDLSKFFP